MKNKKVYLLVLVAAVAAGAGLVALRGQPAAVAAGPDRSALSVAVCQTRRETWPVVVSAFGNIVAWQEAVIGAEVSGLQIASVLVDVGDTVAAGQVLARFEDATVAAAIAEQQASLDVSKALLSEARANAERARVLAGKQVLSEQEIAQYLVAEETARARVKMEEAKLASALIRQQKTVVMAPADGVISARLATPGALAQPGEALFSLIYHGRMEWRAEVPVWDLPKISAGQQVLLKVQGSADVAGVVRVVAPTVNTATRAALVYVDLPAAAAVRPGMFAEGEFQVGSAAGDTLPQSAVTYRDGLSLVFRIDSADRALQTPVTLGRRLGDRVEILDGLGAAERVVASGTGFLSDGDPLRIVQSAEAPRVSISGSDP